MSKIFYTVPDHSDDSVYELKLRGSYDTQDALDQSFIANQCADDYHSNHGGWESSWPLVFVLLETEDGPELCRFSVDREAVPSFSAMRIAPASVRTNGGW